MLFRIFLLGLFLPSLAPAQLIQSLNIIKEIPKYPGYLYKPNDNNSHPAIILLHGSEGGNGDFWYQPSKKPTKTGANGLVPYMARYYATLGYVAYAICYFDCKHHQGYSSYPPDDLKNVDIINITHKALAWLKHSEYVENKKIILWGASRGAEQALLLASLLPELQKTDTSLVIPDGVISLSPIERIRPALPQNVADAIIAGVKPQFSGNGVAWTIKGSSVKNLSVINIQAMKGPVLVTFFITDPVWNHSDITVLKNQFGPESLVDISFAPTDKADDKKQQLPTKFPRATFVEYQSTGHVYPSPTSQESKFLDMTLKSFMHDILIR